MANAEGRKDNPYIIGPPIDEPEKFFGRESLFRFIEDNLRQNVKFILLHGQRRIGKSSVLQMISHFVGQDEFVFVHFDLIAKSQSQLSEILDELATAIVEQLHIEAIQPPDIGQLENNSLLFSSQFLPQVYQALNGKNLVLLLDEFDVVSQENFNIVEQGVRFFSYLEQLLQQQEKLFIIPVVGRHLTDMPNLLKLFKNAPFQEIGLLEELSARRLITKPAEGVLNYEAEAITAILKLSAGHPYFTQVICDSLFKQARSENNWTVTRANVENILDKAIESGEGGLAWFWEGLPIPEQIVLSAVAEAQKIAIKTNQKVPEDPLMLLRNYGVSPTDDLREAANCLADKGFLDDTVRRVKIELVRSWLVQRHPPRQAIAALEERKLAQEEINRLCEIASSLVQQDKKQNALGIYEEALALNPNNFSTLKDLANVYLEVQNFDKALELYERASKFDPIKHQEGLLGALEAYGHNLIILRELSKAKEQFQRVLKIDPNRVSAKQKLEEIQIYESSGVSTWTCEGYRDAAHSLITVNQGQSCPQCSRTFNSSHYSNRYWHKRVWIGTIAAAIVIAPFLCFGVYRLSTPCSAGQQKEFGINCVPDTRRISRGERTFFPSIKNLNRDSGIEAFKKGNYSEAAQFFKQAVADQRNDPEVLIYYNNALAKQKEKDSVLTPLTLAVVVPVDNKAESAKEMLRGVAQAQHKFNNSKGLNGRLLEIVIANDGSESNKIEQVAPEVAKEVVKDTSVLGVIGHNSSDATKAVLAEYEKDKLAIVSPTSTSTFLSSKIFFRTVPSDAESGKTLAEYAFKTKPDLKKIVIFYNRKSPYSNSLKEAFTESFQQKTKGEGKALLIDLNEPNFDTKIREKVAQAGYRYKAEAAILFPSINDTTVAIEIAKTRTNLMANSQDPNSFGLKHLLGGDALYSSTTITEGGQAVEGLILAVPWFREAPQSKTKDFASSAAQQWGGQVSWRTATSFDATQALIKALSSNSTLSPTPNRKTVLQGLRKVKLSSNDTSGDALQFTSEGERQTQPILVKVEAGQFKLQ